MYRIAEVTKNGFLHAFYSGFNSLEEIETFFITIRQQYDNPFINGFFYVTQFRLHDTYFTMKIVRS